MDDGIPVEARYSVLVHIGPGTRPAFCTRVKGVVLTTYPNLAPRLKKDCSYTHNTPSVSLREIIKLTVPFILLACGGHIFLHVTSITFGKPTPYLLTCRYTECPRRNVPDFGRVFLMLNYTDITQNTYVQS